MRDSVVVIGSGMMGSGIGAMSALAGHKTILVDVDEARAARGREQAFECIDVRLENGLASEKAAQHARELISCSTDLAEAASHAFMVIEAIVENLGAKQALFKQLDELLPEDVAICSNTSGLRITDISANCEKHPERMVTTHFWLPAHLVPLVEVVMGDRTEERYAVKVRDELKKWKKAPVLVRRDQPGQLAGRVFQAMIREAVDIVSTGLASPEDVDTAISCGMAMRFPEWGLLTHMDTAGLDLCSSVQSTVLPDLCAGKEPGQALKDRVAAGNLGVKTGKGFYDWSKRSSEKAIAKRDRFIIEAVKITSKLDEEYGE